MIYRKKQYLGDEEEKLSTDIIYGDKKFTQTEINEQIQNQISTYTATGTSINVKDSSNLPIKDFSLLGNASQNGTPTPDSPVPISVVTGDNTLTFTGKNLVNIPTGNKAGQNSSTKQSSVIVSNNTVHVLASVSSSISETDFASAFKLNNELDYTQYGNGTYKTDALTLPAGIYTLCYKKVSGTSSATNSTNNTVSLQIRKKDTTEIGRINLYNKTEAYITFTLTEKTELNIIYSIYANISNAPAISYDIYFQVQLLSGLMADYNFKPYTSQTQLISLGDQELAKIPNTNIKDRIYRDSGKWYWEKNLQKFTITGNENWGTRTNTSTVASKFRCQNILPSNAKGTLLFICNRFPINSGANSADYNDNALCGNADTYAKWLHISILNTIASTVEELKTYLSNNSVSMYYALETPTTTEITDATLIQQLENVLAMTTYQNETNGFWGITAGNEEGEMQIEYYQDIGTLINDLRTAILSLGGNV